MLAALPPIKATHPHLLRHILITWRDWISPANQNSISWREENLISNTEEVFCIAPYRQNYNNPAIATAFLDVTVNTV